jgi:5-methylcytosine-specific restriction endonuclease McrA
VGLPSSPYAGAMRRALVLNATFEPLCVVSAIRALVLVLDGKAEMVRPGSDVVRSEHHIFDAPAVVRLERYVHVPRRRHTPSRRVIFVRDDHVCQYCGRRADSLDHIVPRSRGGRFGWDNLVAACRRCNGRKRDRLPTEAGMALRRQPAKPSEIDWFRAQAGRVPDEWLEFLAVAVSA